MKTKKHDTQWMVSVALMAAIVILLANTPLGMIQLPIIKATTVQDVYKRQILMCHRRMKLYAKSKRDVRQIFKA